MPLDVGSLDKHIEGIQQVHKLRKHYVFIFN
jgi:hypothetical protein